MMVMLQTWIDQQLLQTPTTEVILLPLFKQEDESSSVSVFLFSDQPRNKSNHQNFMWPQNINQQKIVHYFPKHKCYYINNGVYCHESPPCRYCTNPTVYHQYLSIGFVKKHCYKYLPRDYVIEYIESAPYHLFELIIKYFDETSEFFAEIRTRNDYLLSYNKVYQSINWKDCSLDFEVSFGIVIFDDGGIFHHDGNIYSNESIRINAFVDYRKNPRYRNIKHIKHGKIKRSIKINKYLPKHQLSILRKLIKEHCSGKIPYEDEDEFLCGNTCFCCGNGCQLIQALY